MSAMDKMPSEAEVLVALSALGGNSTAKQLCDAIVATGYERGKVQLAIQRAMDRVLVLEKDMSLAFRPSIAAALKAERDKERERCAWVAAQRAMDSSWHIAARNAALSIAGDIRGQA